MVSLNEVVNYSEECYLIAKPTSKLGMDFYVIICVDKKTGVGTELGSYMSSDYTDVMMNQVIRKMKKRDEQGNPKQIRVEV